MGKIKKEKTSKNSHEKKSKGDLSKKRKNGEKKKTTDEGTRKFGYVSASSVITMGEAAGISGIHEDAAQNLAEDVTYRLRYIIQQCKKYMLHSRQRKLTSSHINEVFRMCDVPPVYGYSMDSGLHNFTYVKEADVYVLEDNMIDLPAYALTEIMVEQSPAPTLTGIWSKPEDSKYKSESKSRNDDTRTSNGECHTGDNFKNINSVPSNYESQKVSNETTENETKIPTNIIKYYGITCNTILGHSDLKMVFQDLSTSYRILPIIPYLLNFITMTLNKLASERQIKRLLQSVEALSKNKTIDFSPYLGATRVINAMLLIVAVDKMNYNYHLRDYAARVLSVVLVRWCMRDEQRTIVINKMGKLLSNLKASPKVLYGAIALLTAMGPDALNTSFWGMLDQYLIYLQRMRQDRDTKNPNDLAMMEEVILLAASHFYRFPFTKEQADRINIIKLDKYLYSYFGDTVCNVRLNLLENPEFVATITRSRYLDLECEKQKYSRTLKYLSTNRKPNAARFTVESVFALPKIRKKRNSRIIFKFAGAIPVPEMGLKKRRFNVQNSKFIAGKESEGRAVVVGKFRKISRIQPHLSGCLPVGCIYSVL